MTIAELLSEEEGKISGIAEITNKLNELVKEYKLTDEYKFAEDGKKKNGAKTYSLYKNGEKIGNSTDPYNWKKRNFGYLIKALKEKKSGIAEITNKLNELVKEHHLTDEYKFVEDGKSGSTKQYALYKNGKKIGSNKVPHSWKENNWSYLENQLNVHEYIASNDIEKFHIQKLYNGIKEKPNIQNKSQIKILHPQNAQVLTNKEGEFKDYDHKTQGIKQEDDANGLDIYIDMSGFNGQKLGLELKNTSDLGLAFEGIFKLLRTHKDSDKMNFHFGVMFNKDQLDKFGKHFEKTPTSTKLSYKYKDKPAECGGNNYTDIQYVKSAPRITYTEEFVDTVIEPICKEVSIVFERFEEYENVKEEIIYWNKTPSKQEAMKVFNSILKADAKFRKAFGKGFERSKSFRLCKQLMNRNNQQQNQQLAASTKTYFNY